VAEKAVISFAQDVAEKLFLDHLVTGARRISGVSMNTVADVAEIEMRPSIPHRQQFCKKLKTFSFVNKKYERKEKPLSPHMV
jgi:hypothetical protein